MEHNIKYVLDTGGEVVYQNEFYTVTQNNFGKNTVLQTYSIKPECELEGRTFPDNDQVYYVILGKGDIQLDQQMYEIRPGSVVTIPANTYHRVRNIGQTNFYFICVTGERFNNPNQTVNNDGETFNSVRP
jgi:quercetin dioxygenase-like cupin family protein